MRQENSCLLHCASYAKGIGNDESNAYMPLDRLRAATANEDSWEIACSTAAAGCIYQMWGPSFYTGPIGLVIAPGSDDSFTGAWCEDFGSQFDPSDM